MTNSTMEKHLATLQAKIAPLQAKLEKHPLYAQLSSVEAVSVFMTFHVYAVWDFMSIVKYLQGALTCQSVPWVPRPQPHLTRLINDIILTEESDLNVDGEAQSHFGMYLDAMTDLGLSVAPVQSFVEAVRAGQSVEEAARVSGVPPPVADFNRANFSLLNSDKVHRVAAAFALSRELLIPAMFLEILRHKRQDVRYRKFIYYLERHVEVDGDEHGPAALDMVKILCGEDAVKWAEATEAVILALEARNSLWNAVLAVLTQERPKDRPATTAIIIQKTAEDTMAGI